MKISFVIPAYNEEFYLKKCLASILEETKTLKQDECEIIVVDNASTDKTADIARSFGVKVVFEPQKGLTFARHAGYLAATGDLIANIDADSILTSGWVQKVKDEFKTNASLVALSGPFIFYDLSRATNALIQMYYGLGYAGYIINKYVLKTNAVLQGGNFVIRKSALDKLGGYDLTVTKFYGEDIDIARRLYPLGDIKFAFDMAIYSSGRRIEKEGLVQVGAISIMNYFWITFFKKPFREEYIDIRAQK